MDWKKTRNSNLTRSRDISRPCALEIGVICVRLADTEPLLRFIYARGENGGRPKLN